MVAASAPTFFKSPLIFDIRAASGTKLSTIEAAITIYTRSCITPLKFHEGWETTEREVKFQGATTRC